MLILSSSLILSGCYSSPRKYLIRSVTSNNKEVIAHLDNIEYPVELNKIKSIVLKEVNRYLNHGYPFAEGIVNLESKGESTDVDIKIVKGEYVIVSGMETNTKSINKYLNVWGKNIYDNYYRESDVQKLMKKLSSISFVRVKGKYKILNKKGKYFIYFPLKSRKRTTIGGNVSYINNTLSGRFSIFSNSLFGSNGYLNFKYSAYGRNKNINIVAYMKNIKYSDLDIVSMLNYSVIDTTDYLIGGEIAIAGESYNANSFVAGIGINKSNTYFERYILTGGKFKRKLFDVVWRLTGNQYCAGYYMDFNIRGKFGFGIDKFGFQSSYYGNYDYPIDSLPTVMQNDLCGFNGVRGYKSMTYSADKFLIVRNDLSYRINEFISTGIILDFANFSKRIYSSGVFVTLFTNASKMRINVAAPSWREPSLSVISGEISYTF